MNSKGRLLAILTALLFFGTMVLITNEETVEARLERNQSIGLAHASFIGENTGDRAGKVALLGDVNGDGYDDFIIGSSHNDDGGDRAGKAYLFFGKEQNWAVDVDISNCDASFIGENSNDYAGTSISRAGDVNGDGFHDILISATGNDDQASSAGKIYLIFGKEEGWTRNIDLSGSDASFLGESLGDAAGTPLSPAGDVNGDGLDDFLIGAYQNDEAGTTSGKVYMILGKKSGWTTNTSLGNADASFRGEATADTAGYSISGDVDINGDGYDDIMIGAYLNGEAGTQSGQVYIIFGKRTGWATNTSLSSSDASFRGEAVNNRLGQEVAGVGDLNGDGIDDFMMAAPINDEGGTDAGQVYVVFGKRTGWTMDTGASTSNASFLGEFSDDGITDSISRAGDINNDGFEDIILGTKDNDDGGFNYGKVYVILGKGTGWVMDMEVSGSFASFIGERSGYFGSNVAGGGDVNGDDYDDVMIGAILDSEGGSSAGQVYLVLCNARPPSPMNIETIPNYDGSSITITWNPPSYWNLPITAYRIYRSVDGTHYSLIRSQGARTRVHIDINVEVGTRYYYAVSAVDIDGKISPRTTGIPMVCDQDHDEDGIGDIEDDDDDNDGILDFMDADPDFPDTAWGGGDINLSLFDTKFYGEDRADNAGLSADCSGDVNGDGIDDLVIGAIGNDDGGSVAGKVYLFFGQTGGWDGDVNVSDADASFIGESSQDRAGYCVDNSGDINGDGLNDIVIGADEYYFMGGDEGRAYIIYGKTTGWRYDQDLSTADVRIIGEEDDDEFGRSVASGGDVNGDGYDDVIVGAPSYEPNNANFSGRGYLFLGGPSFRGYYGDAAVAADKVFTAPTEDERLGYSCDISKDVNGDGLDDMIWGAWNYKENSNTLGKAYIVFGQGSWSGTTMLSNPDASFIGQSFGAGRSVAALGDINGDGLGDVIIGEAENNEGSYQAGQAYIILGKESNWSAGTSLAYADASFHGVEGGDNAGYNVDSAGDVNNDGYDDILIGAPRNDDGGYISPYYAGRSYIVFGKPDGWENDVSLSEAELSFYGEEGDEMSGYWVAGGGDVDNDGYDDVLIGAWLHDRGSRNSGAVYLIDHMELPPVTCKYFYRSYNRPTGEPLSESLDAGDQENDPNAAGIYLEWEDTVEDPGFYGILRGVEGKFIKLANTTDLNYTDWDVTPGLTYTYYVVSVDPFGGISDLAEPVIVIADLDTDGDGIGNLMDWDDDDDGVADGEDAFPLNSTESIDTDLDGIGNEYDTDDDNDGIPDVSDSDPLNPLNGIDVELDLTELYRRLVNLEGNVTSDIVDMERNISSRLNTIVNDFGSLIEGMNFTLRDHISQTSTYIVSGYAKLHNMTRGQISKLWGDLNESSRDTLQYLMAMDQALRAELQDITNQLDSIEGGMISQSFITSELDSISEHFDELIGNLNLNNSKKFSEVLSRSDIISSDISDLENALVLEMELLRNMMNIANLTIHHHLDELEEILEDLGISMDEAFIELKDVDASNHQELISKLVNLSSDGSNVQSNISQIITHLNGLESSVSILEEMETIVSNIESRQVESESHIEEVSEGNDSIKTFQFIIIGLVALCVILVAVILVLLLKKRNEKDNDPEKWEK